MTSYNVHPETQYVEFSDLFKENRVWRVYVRLIKKASQQTFTQVDWNLMEEVQVPILSKYLQGEHIPDDLVAELWTETGLVTGKITRSIPTYAPEKNQGKKNYRDSFQQALSMAQSKYEKKLKEGFLPTQSSNCVAHRDEDPKIFPMLAKPYKKNISYPVYAQPKLDGLRCVVFYDAKTKQVVMQSRTRKVFPDNASNDLIRQQLQPILQSLPSLTYLDGELYNHSVKLQDLNHFARGTETDEAPTLEYHVYDILYAPYTHTFEERSRQLQALNSLVQGLRIKVVDTQFVSNEKQLDELYTNYILQGYEGLMVRNPKGVYDFGKRSGNLLKRKEVFTEEFPIVDYTSGTNGKDLNALIWICETSKGDRFKVTPNLTYDERYELFNQAQKKFNKLFKNRLLTVEYRNLSVDQVPQHAKAVVIRDVE